MPASNSRLRSAETNELPGWVHPSAAGRAARNRRLFAGILLDGATAGALGAVVIAAFFAATGTALGRPPLYVATLLGSTAFPSLSGTTAALAWSGLHAVVLVAIGVFTGGLARLAAAAAQGWYVAVLGVLFIAGHIVALPIWFGDAVQRELPLALVLAGTTVGMLVMCAFLWRRNPGITEAMHEPV